MDALRVTYRLRVESAQATARAEAVALEQTVEVPRSVVRDPFVEEQILGRVEEVVPEAGGSHLATIAYPAATTAFDPAQLVNVIFGNSSLHDDVECVDVELPPSILSALEGPRFGLPGLRKAVGVYDRPLTCTAVKPMGLDPAALADLCGSFARAGIDVIKDDHGLADHSFCPFEERVQACLAAVERVAEETGHRAVYVPNLTGTPETIGRQLRFAEDRGARAVLVAPMLVGLPAFWELCHRKASVPVIAHPAFGGAQRIAPELLFGRLFRLYGADAVIYVHFGGRFSYDRAVCRRLADRLVGSWAGILPSLPVPAGGMAVESAAEVVDFYGLESMLLIGGSLQLHRNDLAKRSRGFVEAVRRAAERLGSD
ncbi:MAG: RuBisCO large subunit C-terminal-like domain-containing protein [Myxococcota bacterium]